MRSPLKLNYPRSTKTEVFREESTQLLIENRIPFEEKIAYVEMMLELNGRPLRGQLTFHFLVTTGCTGGYSREALRA